MKLSIVWMFPLINCFLTFAYGKAVIVNLSSKSNNEYYDVNKVDMPRGTTKYVYSAKGPVELSGVQNGKLKLRFPGKPKPKSVTLLKSKIAWVLAVPKASSKSKAGEKAEMYYLVTSKKIKKITQRSFTYYQHAMTLNTVEIDIQSPKDDVAERRVLKDGSVEYQLKDKVAFVKAVKYATTPVWPGAKEKGGVFIRGILAKRKGKTIFVVFYADIDGQQKTSYYQQAGKKWKRLSTKKGEALMVSK